MISTWSKFIYGTTIDETNCNLDFQNGVDVLLATLDAGSRTLGEILDDLEDALNEADENNYVVAINRTTGLVTISGDAIFSLLVSSGANVATSIFTLLGFTGANRTGAITYTGNLRAATTYFPQFLLQSYVGPDDFQRAVDPMVNRTSSGRAELVRFGVDRMIEMDIKFITNLPTDGIVIKYNPAGLTAARSFLQDLVTKSRFEFVPDMNTPTTFYKVILEATAQSKDGSEYKLKELFMQNLPNFYETGILTLRVVD